MQKKSTLPILFITLLVDLIGIGMVVPIIPIIFTDPTSPSFLLEGYAQNMWYIIAGLATGLYGLMQFFAAPILGELSDMFGRKKLLMLGVGVLALSQFMFAIGAMVGSLAIILFSRLVGGLAGANFSIAQASIADISKPEERAKNFGLIGAAFGIGFILGPVLGGYIAHATGTASAPFFVAGILGLLNLISVSLFLPETHHVRKERGSIVLWKALHNLRSAFFDHEASVIYRTSFLYMIGFTAFTSFSGILLEHKFNLSEGQLGTYFGVIGFWVVITQGFILRIITKKYNERQILRVSLVAVACSIACIPFMPTLALQYALVPFIAIPQGLSMANMGALVSKSVSPDKQGAALGINSSLAAFSQGVIPALAGGITALFGISLPFILGACSILVGWHLLFRNKTV